MLAELRELGDSKAWVHFEGRTDQGRIPDDREHIIRIHLKDNKVNPDDYDIDYLVTATDGWNGAEIQLITEQKAVTSRTQHGAAFRDDG